jgi:hypothetical protein
MIVKISSWSISAMERKLIERLADGWRVSKPIWRSWIGKWKLIMIK